MGLLEWEQGKQSKTKQTRRWHLRFFLPLSFIVYYLFDDTGDETGGDGATTFTDIEALAFIGNDGVVCLDNHLDVVTGHNQPGRIVLTLGPVDRGSLIYGESFG